MGIIKPNKKSHNSTFSTFLVRLKKHSLFKDYFSTLFVRNLRYENVTNCLMSHIISDLHAQLADFRPKDLVFQQKHSF